MKSRRGQVASEQGTLSGQAMVTRMGSFMSGHPSCSHRHESLSKAARECAVCKPSGAGTELQEADLAQDAGVCGLDHGVDDGLRVDDDVDGIVAGAEQVVGFDDLQALQHP